MVLFWEMVLAVLAFLGQVVCFWAIWKFLDHVFHPHLEKLKKQPVPEKPVKKPRKPSAKKMSVAEILAATKKKEKEADPKILKLPKEEPDSIILTEIGGDSGEDFLLAPIEMEVEDYTKRRKKSQGK